MGRVSSVLARVLLVVVCAAGCAGSAREPAATRSVSPEQGIESACAGLPPGEVERAVAAFNRGTGLMDQYRPADAAAAFDEAVQLCPQWVPARVNLGIALLNTQDEADLARAGSELQAAAALEPANPYAHFALGMLYSHLVRPADARAQFERVLEIDPRDADAHYQLAILLLDDDPAAARRHLEAALAEMPHHEAATYRLYTLLRRQGETDAANARLARFHELKSSGAGANREMVYGEMGRYAMVMRAFEAPADEGADVPPPFADVAESAGLDFESRDAAGWPGARADGSGFGPGAASADVDGDGDYDVFIPGAGLLINEGGRFRATEGAGVESAGAVAAWFGDYDADGDPDLYLTCDGPNRLYRNSGDGAFVEVTEASGTSGADVVSTGAAWADADHDGDLDLYVANHGAANALFRNHGDGTFTDVAAEAGVDGGDARTMSVLFFDVDDDNDLDLYLVNDGQPNRLFRNDRVGAYVDVTASYAGLADAGPGLGALLGDVDADGRPDVILLRGPEPPRLFVQRARGRFEPTRDFAPRAGAAGGVLGDLDLDGDLDLVLMDAEQNGEFAHAVMMNNGAGHFAPPVRMGPAHDTPHARGVVAVDFDGDGALELLVARAGGRPELWRSPAPANRHWLAVIPARSSDGASQWIHPDAVGLSVEIKTGRRLQVASVSSSSGYLGSPPAVLHFGLGRHTRVDYARLSWPDAVLQGELEIPADQAWRITKAKRKPSSCPILFTWNGERFMFVTDFLGVGGMGFFIAPGVYGPPDPTEAVRIPPELIEPDGGLYRMRIAEPLEEVTYLDELHVVAYDHPRGFELHPDERFTGSAPFPTGRPHAVARKIFPVAATTDRGADVLDRVREIDRRYVEPPRDPRFAGYAHDHWVELDFGARLRSFSRGSRVVLYLYGWVEYTYSHVNYAAYQAGLAMQPPSIEVPDGAGWRVAVPEAGFPAGLPRMMTLDITDLPVGEQGRMRIRTNMEVYWDQIFVGEDVFDDRIRAHTLRPVTAELRYLGYPREYSPDGADPTQYDYQRVDPGLPFKNLTGDFTRFGDVRELLAEVDDRFVIMARGEEIVLDFDAMSLPALAPGWSRTLVLHTDGYCKDMDLYTAYPDTVEPLPYHAMENYPPAQAGPSTEGYEEYRRTWNTRRILERK